MSPESRDLSYLWDMLNAAHKISERITGKRFFDFQQDETLQLAVERLLEIIGEASKRVSMLFREKHPEIPWKRIAGQRDIISHEYDDIIVENIWIVAVEYIPQLITALESLIPNDPKENK